MATGFAPAAIGLATAPGGQLVTLKLLFSPSVYEAETIGSLYNFDAWGSSKNFKLFFASPNISHNGLHGASCLWRQGYQILNT